MALSVLWGLSACQTSQAEATGGPRPPAAGEPRHSPEQVVRRMEPAPAPRAAGAAPGARLSSAGARPGEAITPRRLEAELDRLEAEIGN